MSKKKSEKPEVKIYSTSVCPYCDSAKSFLKENNIDYEEVDVSVNEKAQEEMVQKSGGLSVPVIEINKEIIVGFDKQRISELLGIK